MKHFIFFIIFLVIKSSAFAEENHYHDATVDLHSNHKEHNLKFSKAQLQEFSIELAQVSSGHIQQTLALTGEVVIDPQRLYHVTPHVSGIVRHVYKNLGDPVKKGDLLATIHSRNLAKIKAQLIATHSLLTLAQATLQREQSLFEQEISAKRHYLAAQQAFAEIEAKFNAAKQHLFTLGFNEAAITQILQKINQDTGLYPLYASHNGIILQQHMVQGEVLAADAHSFTLADLSTVWVNLTVYQKDLALITRGQRSLIHSDQGQSLATTGNITWISPILDKKTRSGIARVVITNPKGDWRPGLFVKATVTLDHTLLDMVIPQTALQTLNEKPVVFVEHSAGEFEPQEVKIGRKDTQQVEILQGLSIGQTYVRKNAFVLKAHQQKGQFGDRHHH